MIRQVAEEKRHSEELTAQLASLKGTTAEVEGAFRKGKAALAAYEAAQAAKQAAAEEQSRQADAAARLSAALPAAPAIPAPANPAPGPWGRTAGARTSSFASPSSGPKESNWLTTATNPYSGAYGIAQAQPASKYSSAGRDWVTSYRTQVEWGLGYIRGRYGSPCAAWNHSVARNWY